MGSKGFIRGIWGNNKRIMGDIAVAIKMDVPNKLDFICYTWGEDNHKTLLSQNIKSVLINKNSHVYPTPRGMVNFRYKLDLFEFGLRDFDEIVYLDWDCNMVKDIGEDFWTELNKKDIIQGCLYRWKRPVCPWRETRHDQSYIINNGFLYLRDKSTPKHLVFQWNKMQSMNDEVPTSFYIDELMGGWKGETYWREHYEAESAHMICHPVFQKPNHIFYHT